MSANPSLFDYVRSAGYRWCDAADAAGRPRDRAELEAALVQSVAEFDRTHAEASDLYDADRRGVVSSVTEWCLTKYKGSAAGCPGGMTR
jgi:hypothetical protein